MLGTEHFTRWILHRIRTAVAIGVRDAIDISRKWLEPRFVRMRLAGQGHSHIRAAMERIFKADDRRTLRITTRDFDRVLSCFGASADQQSLLGKLSGSERVEFLAHRDITLVWKHVETGVQETVELASHRLHD